MHDSLLPGQKAAGENAYVRFLQASLNTGSLDIYINGCLMLHNFHYKMTSTYVPLTRGIHQIDLYQTGERIKPILSEKVTIEQYHFYTLAVVGAVKKLQLLPFLCQPKVPAGESKIRFLHLAAEAPVLDIAVKDRDVVFPDLGFKHATNYLGLTPMTVDLEARTAGGKEVVLPLPKMKFLAGYTYSIALIGSVSLTPSLEAIVLID
ncbi:DUF4397 domain-containing protein [Bacillota bacterium Lsc_1132]